LIPYNKAVRDNIPEIIQADGKKCIYKSLPDDQFLVELEKKLGEEPETIITDGLPAYHDAYKKAFWTLKGPRTQHINAIKLKGDRNNNKMERLNGEIRDREKVMRGLKKKDTPILPGIQIYHNYVRPHQGLNGKTPADACGIEIKGTTNGRP
jgi:transposase-like protein